MADNIIFFSHSQSNVSYYLRLINDENFFLIFDRPQDKRRKNFYNLSKDLSSSLISLIKNALPGDLEIQILTYKINQSEYIAIQNEINSIDSQIDLSIKILNVRGKPLDIHQSKRIPNPFHDRFIISGGDALIVGTSLNSIITNSTFINQMSNFKILEQKFNEWFSGVDIRYSGNALYFEDLVI